MNHCILGFDWGFRRIGVAIGNSILNQANPLPLLKTREGEPPWDEIQKIFKTWKPHAIVVGIPTTIKGEVLSSTEKAEAFCLSLETRFSLPVHRVDERLTTVEARSQLFEVGGYKKLRKTDIDSFAAKLIVEQWLIEHS